MSNYDWVAKEVFGKDAFAMIGRFVVYQIGKFVINGKEVERSIIGGVGMPSPSNSTNTELIMGDLIIIPKVKLVAPINGYRLDQMVCSYEFAHPEQHFGEGKFWRKQTYGEPFPQSFKRGGG